MKVTLEKVENNTAFVNVEADAEEFDKAVGQSYRKNVKRFFVPGFRKGKAPRRMVELHYGPEVLYEDAAEILLPDAFDQAVKENGLEPIDQPKYDVSQIELGKPMLASIEITVKPEVILPEYKGLEVEKLVYNVTEEEIDKELTALQDKNARLVAVEDQAAEEHDIAVIDFEGSVDGVPFEGGKGENYPLHLGSGTFIPGFEEQVIGMKTGEERDIKVTFPEQYQSQDVAGKDVVFKVNVKELKRKELLTIDDEFAKDVSEFDTLEELKDDIRLKLEKKARALEEGALKGAVVNKLSEMVEVEIPKIMIDKETERLMMDFAMNLQYSGIDISTYLKATGASAESFKADFKEKAAANVKSSLILDEVAKRENIKVTDEELEKKIGDYAQLAKKTVDEYKKGLQPQDIQGIGDSILTQKVFDLLIDNARLTEKIAEAVHEEN